jgi:excisionase family DNA binding protein
MTIEPMNFLTVSEIAAALRINPETVRRWLKARLLPGMRIGRRWRVKEEDLTAFYGRLVAKQRGKTK